MSRALVVAAILALGSHAHADDEVSTQRRAAAIGASLVPGVLVHGSGSWLLHEKRAAKRLAITGWIGLGAMAIGGAAVGVSGGSTYTVFWGVPMIMAGGALWLPTWFSDVWYAAGGPRIRGESHTAAPWSLELGTTWVHDAYRERALARAVGRIELGRIELAASGLADVEGNASTGELATRVRILGARSTGATVSDASNLYLRAALRRHIDHDDRVAIATIEADAGARLDMQRIDPNLAGTFLELAIGYGAERVTYNDDIVEYDSLFLGRFAWGLYLGTRSELVVYYDHRRDSIAGGIAAGRAAGFVGSVGTQLDLRLGGPFSFAGELQIGSAWVTTLGIRYHGGPL